MHESESKGKDSAEGDKVIPMMSLYRIIRCFSLAQVYKNIQSNQHFPSTGKWSQMLE